MSEGRETPVYAPRITIPSPLSGAGDRMSVEICMCLIKEGGEMATFIANLFSEGF